MPIIDSMVARLAYGSCRRPFRGIVRRCLGDQGRILFGGLRGAQFNGVEIDYRLGVYELTIQQLLCRLLKPGDIFYDVGANIGYFSALAARKVGEGGDVCAFEPLPENARRVRDLVSRNGFHHCQVYDMAVADESGTKSLFVSPGDSCATPSLLKGRRSAEIRVKTVTLDEFATDKRRPDFVKIDVEGAEMLVLAGARGLISSAEPPTWLIEVHGPIPDRDAVDLFTTNGYTIERIPPFMRRQAGYPEHILAYKR